MESLRRARAAHGFTRSENARITGFDRHAREYLTIGLEYKGCGRQNPRVGKRLDRASRRSGYGKKSEKCSDERNSARYSVRTVHGKEKVMMACERRKGAAGKPTASMYYIARHFISYAAACP